MSEHDGPAARFLQRAALQRDMENDAWDEALQDETPDLSDAALSSPLESGNEGFGFPWSGNTLLDPSPEAQRSVGGGDYRGLDDSPSFTDYHSLTPGMKEEPWLTKAEISGPLSPLTPLHHLATPTTPFSILDSQIVPSAAQSPNAACPFRAGDASASAEAVLDSILSPVEGGTVEATLDDIDLSDINAGSVGITAFNNFAPPPPRKRQATIRDDSNDFECHGLPLAGPNGVQMFEPILSDFHIPVVDGQAASSADSIDLDFCILGSMVASSKDVMARAALAAVTAAAAGSSEDRARPWACELCPSRFSIKGHLSQHNRYVHEKYRPHCCPKVGCSASFGTRFARSQHIWTVHERKKPFACEVEGCIASFGQRSHLNRHRKRHRLETSPAEAGEDASPITIQNLSVVKAISKPSRPVAGGVGSHVASHLFPSKKVSGRNRG
jgi:hypothetical protein